MTLLVRRTQLDKKIYTNGNLGEYITEYLSVSSRFIHSC